MREKELVVTPPEGYMIDEENSTFSCIKFKPMEITYKDVATNLFNGMYYFICGNGEIRKQADLNEIMHPNIAVSEKQLMKVLAINKLLNVARYLNGDWKPDWDDYDDSKYFIEINYETNELNISICGRVSSELVYFKSRLLAEMAIEILGEDNIRLALSTSI